MMNDNENMVSDAAAQDMELTDPQGSEPQSADAKNAQEASSADDFHRTGRMQLYVRRFMRRPSAVVGLVVLILLILLAIFGSKFSQWSYDEPDFAALASPPSAQHLLGTTVGGSDMYAMIIRGLGRSLTIGIFSSIGTTIIAALVGTAVAFFEGWFEKVGMWMLDMLLVVPILPAHRPDRRHGNGRQRLAVAGHRPDRVRLDWLCAYAAYPDPELA